MTALSANELQARFEEIGLPESLMIELQITELEVAWNNETQEKRDRFLNQGYTLVVDRSCVPARAYLVAPTHKRNNIEAVPVS
jgi:hypothetical protein